MASSIILSQIDYTAALFVVGFLILVGGPLLYWVLFKTDADNKSIEVEIPPVSLTRDAIGYIESSLDVTLPSEYVNFLGARDDHPIIDGTTMICDAQEIVAQTQAMREGRNQWGKSWVYVGDEADASPYALDCSTGNLRRTPKGSMIEQPLNEYTNFGSFINEYERSISDAEDGKGQAPNPQWAEFIGKNLVWIALTSIFIILPLIAFLLSLVWKWILK